MRATNILLAAAAGLATASYLIHRQSATPPRKERRNAANARRTKPGIICTALSLIITFGVIPALIAAPFILTYLVTQSIEKAIFYPIIIICGIISFGCAIAGSRIPDSTILVLHLAELHQAPRSPVPTTEGHHEIVRISEELQSPVHHHHPQPRDRRSITPGRKNIPVPPGRKHPGIPEQRTLRLRRERNTIDMTELTNLTNLTNEKIGKLVSDYYHNEARKAQLRAQLAQDRGEYGPS